MAAAATSRPLKRSIGKEAQHFRSTAQRGVQGIAVSYGFSHSSPVHQGLSARIWETEAQHPTIYPHEAHSTIVVARLDMITRNKDVSLVMRRLWEFLKQAGIPSINVLFSDWALYVIRRYHT